MLPKLVLTDIDGVWTDGGMYYDQEGNEWKKFNTSDSAGILLLNVLNIPCGIITGETTSIVQHRADKLRIRMVYQGVKDKLGVAKHICGHMQIHLQDVAYIGDDITDLRLLKFVGFSAAPVNAPDYIKSEVDFVVNCRGGDGAFRVFVEHILRENNLLSGCIETLTLTQPATNDD